MKKIYLGLVVLAICPSLAKAQEKSTNLEDVVVLSDKLQIPFKNQNRNIQILTAEQIAQMPAKSVNELLSYIAGIDVRQRGPNGSQADIGIDGGTFDQTLVLLNGFKMTDVQTGHNLMNIPVPLASIERIEVLKGAAARLYGANALMGVINIVTKKDATNNLLAQTYAGSSFKQDDSTGKTYINKGIQLVGQVASKNWKHLLAGAFDGGNGYRYNTAYDNYKALYTANGKINENIGLELMGGITNNAFGANNFYAAPYDKEATEEVKTLNFAFRMPIQVNKNWTLRPSANYRNGYDHYIYTRKNPSLYENKHHTNTVDASIDNLINTAVGNFAFGLNLRSESISSNNLGDRNRMNYGAFVAYQYQYQNKFDLNAGIYFNQNSVFGFKAYPGIDIGYALNDAWRIYANAGMGQRLPTFTDLYYQSPNNLGNDQLKPEFMTSYEAGAKYFKSKARLNASVFYKNGADFIDWVRPDSTSAWQVNNFTTLNTFGFHVDGSYTFDWNKNILSIYSSYTYLDPKIGAISDASKQGWSSQYAINSLQHQWIVRANYSWNKAWNFSLANRMVKRQNAGADLNGYSRKSYQLMDAKLTYQINNFSIDLSANNVFNVQYIESGVVPLPGLWSTLGLRYQLK